MEPNRERRKVWWAVLASVVLHLLIGLSLAAFGGSTQEIALEQEPPPQLTIMQLPEPTPTPLVPKNPPMTTVDPARKSAVAPKEKTFEANENSIAAAEKAATEDNFLPGQDGKDRPFMNLDTHENSFDSAGSKPQPNLLRPRHPKKKPRPHLTQPLDPPPQPPRRTSSHSLPRLRRPFPPHPIVNSRARFPRRRRLPPPRLCPRRRRQRQRPVIRICSRRRLSGAGLATAAVRP